MRYLCIHAATSAVGGSSTAQANSLPRERLRFIASYTHGTLATFVTWSIRIARCGRAKGPQRVPQGQYIEKIVKTK